MTKVRANPTKHAFSINTVKRTGLVRLDSSKERRKSVVIGLWNRITLVVVAACATKPNPQESTGGDIHNAVHVIGDCLGEIRNFVVPHAQSVIAGGKE